MRFLFLFVISSCFVSTPGLSFSNPKEAEIMDKVLKDYLGDVIPWFPVKVAVGFALDRVFMVENDQFERSFVFSLAYHEKWMDQRLNLSRFSNPPDFIDLPKSVADKIWKPTSFFVDEVNNSPIEKDCLYKNMRFFKDGTVKMIIRTQKTFTCGGFKGYPFALLHNCTISVTSLDFRKNTVRYEWDSDVIVDKNMEFGIPGYRFLGFHQEKQELFIHEGDDFRYEALSIKFSLERFEDKKAIVELYHIPTCFVVVSWVGFVLPSWQKEGVGISAAVFGFFYWAEPQIVANHPLSEFSTAQTFVRGCLEFLMSDLVILVFLSVSYQVLSMRQKEEKEIEWGIKAGWLKQFESVGFKILPYLRFLVLLVSIAAFFGWKSKL